MKNILAIAQVIVSLVIIVLILLQERSAGLSGIFGDVSSFYQTRRGMEKTIFAATIGLAVIFLALSVAQLLA